MEWHKFDIKDKNTYPPKKGNYIVSLHFPPDFNISDYTSEGNWAEYMNGEFDWSPQFESQFVAAWAFMPEPYKQ